MEDNGGGQKIFFKDDLGNIRLNPWGGGGKIRVFHMGDGAREINKGGVGKKIGASAGKKDF